MLTRKLMSIPIRKIKRSSKFESGGFSIRRIEDITPDQELSQPVHRHEFYFLLAIRSGTGTHEIDLVKHTVTPGDIFFMRPGQVHQLSLKKNAKGYIIEFDASFISNSSTEFTDVIRRVTSKPKCSLASEKRERIFSLLDDMYLEASHDQERSREVLQAQSKILFIELYRNRQQHNSPAKAFHLEQFEKLITLIEKHVTVEKHSYYYSKKLGCSIYQLNALTRTMVGKTCAQLIREEIILEARRLLITSTSQVTQIAFELGFDDPSYFTRLFKKETGVTPEAYRKKTL